MSDVLKNLKYFRKPIGKNGKAVVDGMNDKHYEITGWGLEKVNIPSDFHVLDIGCGGGRTVNRIASIVDEGTVVGIDYSSDCVKWSNEYNRDFIEKGRVTILKESVERLPFKDEEFDLICAVETIYFWPNIVENLKEVKRVLKKYGKLIIINELYDVDVLKEKNNELIKLGNMKIYSPSELENILINVGFNDVKQFLNEDRRWICYLGEK